MPSNDLIVASLAIGADPLLVQGAGGNLSEKQDDGFMAIKSSGTRLRDAHERHIYATLALDQTRREVLERENLSDLVDDESRSAGLRPSIETSIHALLPHRFVFHVHSVAAIAAGCSLNPDALAPLAGIAEVTHVPYSKPGIELAHAILTAIGPEPSTDDRIVILQNHGLITASRTAKRALEMIAQSELALTQRWFEESPDRQSTPSIDGWEVVGSAALNAEQAERLAGGPLTPDSAVFLGGRPFTLDRNDVAASALVENGLLAVRTGLSQDAREIAISLVEVAKRFPPGPVSKLGPARIDELIDWEAEKWRKAQER